MPNANERLHYDRFNTVINDPGYQSLRTYGLQDNQALRFEITVAARQTDGANRASFKRTALFYREGGNVLLQGTQWHTVDTHKSDINMDIKYILGLDTIEIQVRNAGATPTRWVGFVDVVKVK